jgi:AmmeMemoRadiSam system protein B
MSALTAQISKFLTTTKFEVSIPKSVFAKALISPHAGLMYSGQTAAYGFRIMRDTINRNPIKRIFILGPSHHFYLSGCAMSDATLAETPLGFLKVDTQIKKELERSGLFKKITMDQDEEEHSLELQFPFVKYITEKKDIPIVNIMVGDMSEEYVQKMSKVLKPYFLDNESLFVFSTDFCHWGQRFGYMEDYRQSTREQIWEGIQRLDMNGVKFIENKDAKGFSNYLKKTKNTVCGKNPIRLLLGLMQDFDIKDVYTLQNLKYDQSEQVKTKYDSSVSYVSLLVYK